MQTTRPNQASGLGRYASRRWTTKLGFLALAGCALLSEGCASFGRGCGTSACGPTGLSRVTSRITSCNLGQKLFRRRGTAIVTDSCEPGLGAMPVEGGMIVPSGPVLAPPPETEPNIQPNPGGSLKDPTTGSKSGTVKSLYQAQMSEPRGEAPLARREAASPSSARDPLADIPSLAPAQDAAPSAESSPPAAPTAGDRPAPEKTPDITTKPAEITAGLGPGIRRFRVIEPRLAVGSLPTESGWKWLAELRYKTVIDLRQPSEISQDDLAAVNHHALRYIAIPMSKDSLDPASLAKLEAELAREDSRPIFVFDNDGIRPAAAGFLHLATVRKMDAHSAEREVEELGAGESPLWKAAVDHFSKLKPESGATTQGAPVKSTEKPASSSVLGMSRTVRP